MLALRGVSRVGARSPGDRCDLWLRAHVLRVQGSWLRVHDCTDAGLFVLGLREWHA